MAMELTWQDISKIVRLYEEIEHEDDVRASDWCMDEDNTGISYDYMTREDICKQVLLQINK